MHSSGSKRLVAVPAVVAVIGLVLLIIGLLSGSGVQLSQFGNGSTVSLDGGFSVYSKTAADRTATFCRVGGTTLGRPIRDFSVSADGTKYYEVARSTVSAGTVTCTGNSGALYAGTRADRLADGFRTTGVVLGVILLVLGLVGAALLVLLGTKTGRQHVGDGSLPDDEHRSDHR